MKFRSKPNEIDAEQFTPDHIPDGVKTHMEEGEIVKYTVTTINGNVAEVHHGDWIITEPDGVHHYPCKPDIFEKRYEPAE